MATSSICLQVNLGGVELGDVGDLELVVVVEGPGLGRPAGGSGGVTLRLGLHGGVGRGDERRPHRGIVGPLPPPWATLGGERRRRLVLLEVDGGEARARGGDGGSAVETASAPVAGGEAPNWPAATTLSCFTSSANGPFSRLASTSSLTRGGMVLAACGSGGVQRSVLLAEPVVVGGLARRGAFQGRPDGSNPRSDLA